MKPDGKRKFLDDALKEYHTAPSSDSKLHSLWKISQLVEDTTEEELYELASAVAVEEDYRLRGEICYTISRSRRPQLIQVLQEMIQDENSYVRRSAITAMGELGGTREITLAAIEPVMDDMEKLKSTVMALEEKLIQLYNSIEKLDGTAVSSSAGHEIVMDNHMKCWETYLRYERELLRDHRGEYVAIYGDEIVDIDEYPEKLAEIIYEKYGHVEALICRIEEEDAPIQMPPPRQILS